MKSVDTMSVRACVRRNSNQARKQSGFSLVFALIALVILLMATVSVMRSSGLNLFSAGNASFKQDMVARSDAVNVRIFALLRAGGALATESSLGSSLKSSNYSATALQTNAQGLPLALINDSTFDAVGDSANDIRDDASNTVIRYVMERLCDQTGNSAALGREHCVYNPDRNPVQGGSSTQASTAIPPSFSPIYRVSVRIQGPRGSEAYLQNTFTKPN